METKLQQSVWVLALALLLMAITSTLFGKI